MQKLISKALLRTALTVFLIFPPISIAYTLSDADNKLIELGREQITVPSEIDLDLDELTRFVGALFEHRNVLSEITARMAVGKEDRVALVEEMVDRNKKVFAKYQITAERVAILEHILFQIPEMTDYIEAIAMELPQDVRKNAAIPESFQDVIDRLEGVVDYNVRAAIQEQLSTTSSALNRSKTSGNLFSY
ncbi:hypothetical protein [Marinobacter sp. P4B1]|uniref:hypothetical protein n=1 Tax=Marinobacter sp. P4B1 TaxID=1119533 RepID=UPI00119D602D|nr:hypothetical protein [Marinobacter sp. P4B1]